MFLVFLLLFLAVIQPQSAHAGPVLSRLQAASQDTRPEDFSATFDGLSPILAVPVAVSTAPIVKEIPPEPEFKPKQEYHHPWPEIHVMPAIEIVPTSHEEELDPVWAASNGGQIISSSTSLMNSVTMVPAMASMGPLGIVLGGFFAAAAAVVAVEAGIESYQVVKRAWF